MKRFCLVSVIIFLLASLLACESATEPVSNDRTSQNPPIESSATEISFDESESSVSEEISETESSSSDPYNESVEESDSDESSEPVEHEITIHAVPVIIRGEDAIKETGYRVSGGLDKTIDVVLFGFDGVTADDITAYVNVAGVAETGNLEFVINIVVPDGYRLVSQSENFATVKIKAASTSDEPTVSNEAYLIDGIIISGTRAMEQFGGKASSGQSTAEKLNIFKEAVGNDVSVYILPAPLASAFYAPEKYSKSISRHRECFEGIRDSLVGVNYVDTLGALGTHVDENIYARTDHHWSALGAYYCAEAFAELAGVPFADLSTFTMKSFDGYLGSMLGYTNKASVIKNNPETFTWYEPNAEYTVIYYTKDYFKKPFEGELFSSSKSYSKFIYGDSYTTRITTNVGNGRRLLIFKDSYGNALASFVVSSFDEIFIADYRYFRLNAVEFIEEYGITDVCFAMSAFGVAGSSRNYITKLINY